MINKEESPLCPSINGTQFLSLKKMPVSIGVQWPSQEEAVNCGRGDIDLAFCSQSGFIWNQSFDPDAMEYSLRYDNSLDYSPVFQEYAKGLARRLVETYDIKNKDIVELGCGKGHFLNLICEEGNNSGVGFDPSYEGQRFESSAADRITYYQDFYGEKYTSHQGDLVCCRHVLEHIEDPVEFLQIVRKTINDNYDTIVYFEVPNVRFILQKLSVWDIIYEHCNYFSLESLTYVFQKCGFEVIRIEESYGGQFISLEAKLAKGDTLKSLDLSDLKNSVDEFSDKFRERSETWNARLEKSASENKKVVLWGGGAKAVSFLNMLERGDVISHVVDINPNKQGLFIPGGGQEIVAPDYLKKLQPDTVVIMNPLYEKEIRLQLDELGVKAELISS